MKIKNYIWVVLIIGLIAIPSAAQVARLTASERVSALDTTLATTCADTTAMAAAPIAPRVLAHDRQVFSPDRIARTLNGVWIGRVIGEYDPQLLAKDGALNVDYYMIVDIKRGEAFVYEEFGNKRSGAGLRPKPGAPVWSYTWCARENYKDKSPRQVHTFTKVSDNVDDAQKVLSNSLGAKFTGGSKVVLSDVWKRLVAAKFFDNPKRSLGYAGVLFKPITLGSITTAAGGGSLLELRMVGEYRGIGETAAKFVPGEPIHNVEQGHFLGLSGAKAQVPQGASLLAGDSMGSGDYLSASTQLTNAMIGPKADALASVFSTQMAFDKVVIGPLAPGATASASGRKPKR